MVCFFFSHINNLSETTVHLHFCWMYAHWLKNVLVLRLRWNCISQLQSPNDYTLLWGQLSNSKLWNEKVTNKTEIKKGKNGIEMLVFLNTLGFTTLISHLLCSHCHVVVLCTYDIYCMSVHPRERIPPLRLFLRFLIFFPC